MSDIHPTAVVDPGARLGANVRIGPFAIVGPDVVLGDGVNIISHSVISGRTEIGAGTRVFQFVTIGAEPQDLSYRGEPTGVVIGSNCTIRENATIHRGTKKGGGLTRVGNDCFLMANTHIAHDCAVGNNVIMVNCAMLGGHVQVGDFAIIGGLSAVVQRLRIGAHAFVGGHSGIGGDLIPFGIGVGRGARLGGLNLIGLKRRGFSRKAIHALRAAYKEIFLSDKGAIMDRLDNVAAKHADVPEVISVVEFIRQTNGGPLCVPRDENSD